MASVEKTYADAMFSLLQEEKADRTVFDAVLGQLNVVGESFSRTPDLFKLMNTPTVSDEEKLGVVNAVFDGKVSDYVRNFLRLLAVKKRMSCFPQILREFRTQYNEHFGLAEIVITSAMPVTAEQKSRITAKMAEITGTAKENIVVTERIDKALIGGITVEHGNTRYDGSVRTRLGELAKDIAGVVA
jgi:F-type H+-transporting ATPase subunit delta